MLSAKWFCIPLSSLIMPLLAKESGKKLLKFEFSFVEADWLDSKGTKPDCLWKLKPKPWT